MKTNSTKASSKVKEPKGGGTFISEMVDALVEIGGAGTTQLLGSNEKALKIRGVISTQCAPLDKAIGRGGIPLGRLTIVHGKEGSGKTTLALHIVAETQSLGGIVIYMDTEYKLDPDYARAIGVDVDSMIISQPPYLEKAYQLIDGAIDAAKRHRVATGKRVPILIVMDSMNSTISKREYAGDWEDEHMAAQARVHSKLLPKLIPKVSAEDVALLFISQVRSKMNTMPGAEQDQPNGGNAPRFHASLIMKVSNIGGVKDGEDRVANKTVVDCRKNQIAPPFRHAEFQIRYGVGIDRLGSLFDEAVESGYIIKSGAFYKLHSGEKLGQGRESAMEQLKESNDYMDQLVADMESGVAPIKPPKSAEDDDDDAPKSKKFKGKKKARRDAD